MSRIKAYTLHDGTVFFDKLEYMPVVGDFYEREEILAIDKVELAGRQPFESISIQGDGEYLEFFKLITTFNRDPEDTYEYFVACWVKEEE